MADWTDKLVIHSFKGINIELVNGEWKKKPNGIRPEWTKLTESSINKKDRGLAVLTGSKSGILVLDFDDKNIYDDFTMRHPTIKNAPRVVTRKGFHIYFIWKDIYTELPSKIGKLDIQGNGKQVFYVGTEYKTETGDPFTYSWDYYQDLIDLPNELYQELKRSKNPVKKNTEQNVLKIECDDKLWRDIIENINIKYIDEYQSWFHLICGLYSIGKESDNLDHYKEVARSMSMKSKKYDKTHREFEKIWENCGKYSFTGASVRHYSRESNEEVYLSICKNHAGKETAFYVFDEKLLADYFIESFGDNLVCCKSKIYVYLNQTWKEDNKGIIIQRFLCEEVRKLYKKIINELNKQLQNSDETESISKTLKEVNKVLTNYGNQKNKNVWGLIYNELITRNIDRDIFDSQKNYFVFNNRGYNLETNTFLYINKFDYILTNCGHDYKEPTKIQMDKIDNLFNSIFPNEEYKKAYISILKSGLSGFRPEKFIVATGGGRNGKGFINDFFKYLLGDYYGTLHLSLLTKEIKGGANTELRSLHKKRFIKATEPDSNSNERLRMSNIKALTGESHLKARGLYENDFEIEIDATQLLECNKLPYINTDGNEAEKQRLVIIPFEITFTDNDEDINKDPANFKQMDTTLKSAEFLEEHKCAFFKYIIDNHKGLDLYIPDACKKLALKWMLDKDDFAGWFFENYKEQEGAVTSIKELYKDFKYSSFFSSMTKAQQRCNNEKYFKEMIECKLKHIFVKGNSYVNNVRIIKDSVVGYTKLLCDDEDDDC